MTNIAKIRARKFIEQRGRCHYCQQPMWVGDPAGFAERYRISGRQARCLQSTAEHLIAQSDGGKDVEANIVAACVYCNRSRHRMKRPLAPEAFRKRVKARMMRGKWHCLRIATP